MGEVFLAVHRCLNKPVVVKLLHRQLMKDAWFADRLRVEAQALAAVASPSRGVRTSRRSPLCSWRSLLWRVP